MRQLDYFQNYAEERFKYFPSEYFKFLESFLVEKEKPVKILDIGCGPGNWTIAIAQYNQNAEVIGIDINDDLLEIAEHYKQKFNCNNANFYKLDYKDISSRFQPDSFDHIFTMSVLQYLNEELYFKNISRVLKVDRQLFIFWTHSIGYYIRKIFSGLKEMSLNAFAWAPPIFKGLTFQKISEEGDHAVMYWRTKKIAGNYGIELKRASLTPLCRKYYRDKFLFFPYVLNMTGVKSKTYGESW